ncbi:MAG: DNA-processing protein DprA [Propionibacteriaceae bacterium]|nr:DNA-processing protein DprA [Propionibacteriaceae bacterium]
MRMRYITPGVDEWPAQLGDLSGSAPAGLWVRGEANLAELCGRSVAIVGARASTPYGEHVAFEMAEGLSCGGFTVVSGGAVGIDSAAHNAALSGPTPTVAVLAGGLDRCHPAVNDPLFSRIADGGGLLVSEYPPGEHPTRERFLQRNRLIAALSQATVVVEGADRSGARSTVEWATMLGRPVGATPGSVYSAMSRLPHQLIREGKATLVANAADVKELPGLASPPDLGRAADEPINVGVAHEQAQELAPAAAGGVKI